MDFFEHQERARHKTTLLAVYFVAAVVLIILSVYLAIAALLFYGQSSRDGGPPATLWFPDVFAAVSVGTVILITLGSLYKMAELSGGGRRWLARLAAAPCQPTPSICASAFS